MYLSSRNRVISVLSLLVIISTSVFSYTPSSAVIIPNESEAKHAIAAKNNELVSTGRFSGVPAPDMPSPALTARKDGYYQFFKGYGIWYKPSLGASEVHGDILDKWRSLNFESGPLGFPATDETPVLGNPGEKYNAFENGFLSTTPIGVRWFEKIYDEMPGSHTLMVSVDNIIIKDSHDALGSGEWHMFARLYEKDNPSRLTKYISINDYGYTNLGLDKAVSGATYYIAKAEAFEVPPNGILRIVITGTEVNGQVDPPDSKKADCFGQACPESDDEQLGEIVQDFGPGSNYGIGQHCNKSSLGDYELCYHITEMGYDLAEGTLPIRLTSLSCNQKSASMFTCNVSGGDIHEIVCSGNILMPTEIRAGCSSNNGNFFLCNFYGELIRCGRS